MGPQGPGFPDDLWRSLDPAFVAALRACADRDRLAGFAAEWWHDPRPGARALLLGYLDQPPNAPGHEGLVKRLFKLAEAAEDDDAMARFAALADRLVRRRRWTEYRPERRRFVHEADAEACRAGWVAAGYRDVRRVRLRFWQEVRPARQMVVGLRPVPRSSASRTTLPRDRPLNDLDDPSTLRWFSVSTRRHLARRAWRYFRRVGKVDPARYARLAGSTLALARDVDLPDAHALLDCPTLVAILFGAGPVLEPTAAGWRVAPGRSIAELAPAPRFEAAWLDAPELVFALLARAKGCRLVRRWAARWADAHFDDFRAIGPADAWAAWLADPDPEVVAVAARVLAARSPEALAEVNAARWVDAASAADSDALAEVCELVGRAVDLDRVPTPDALRLARSAAEASARLGWGWVLARADAGEVSAPDWLSMLGARCPTLRGEILAEVVGRLAPIARRLGDPSALVALLESPHADARLEGWRWFRDDPRWRSDPEAWRRALGSPFDDVRGWCAADPAAPIGLEATRDARALLLFDPDRPSRLAVPAIRHLGRRLTALASAGGDEAEAEVEADALIRLIGVASRSLRSPERRAAVAALVAAVELRPDWRGRVESSVPALQCGPPEAIIPP